jgi:hypothetical protein
MHLSLITLTCFFCNNAQYNRSLPERQFRTRSATVGARRMNKHTYQFMDVAPGAVFK